MIEKIDPWVRGKKILLLGFGREGKSTWEVLRRLGTFQSVDIADQSAPGELPEGIGKWISGPDYQSCLNDYDVVFKSPGVVLEKPVQDYSCQILSQTEVFFRCFRDQIIGITGTKGKSTITTLLYHLLKHAGYDTVLAGNIGIPVFDLMEEIVPETKIVCELSCHQLEYMTVSPHIAILSNIHEEHLDHYGTMEKYVRAKEHIFLNQTPEDVLICSVQCLPEPGECVSRLITAKSSFPEPPLERFWKTEGFLNQTPEDVLICSVQCLPEPGECVSRLITAKSSFPEPPLERFWKTEGNLADRKKREEAPVLYVEEKDGVTSICYEGRRYKIPTGQIRLLGQHNYFDIGMAYAVCSLLGMAEETFTEGLKEYEPLPHRLQFLGEIQGVKYYDDSISTICETAIQALKTLKDTDAIQALKTLKDTDTILIGGMDRGIDYRELIEYLSQSQVPHIILMEATGKRIFEEIAADYPDFENPSRLLLAEHRELIEYLSQSQVPHIILMEATGKRIFEEIAADYPDFENPSRLLLAEHLKDAVCLAKKVTRPGRSCVMSPAAASYGIFRNFEERGEEFKRLVLENEQQDTVF